MPLALLCLGNISWAYLDLPLDQSNVEIIFRILVKQVSGIWIGSVLKTYKILGSIDILNAARRPAYDKYSFPILVVSF